MFHSLLQSWESGHAQTGIQRSAGAKPVPKFKHQDHLNLVVGERLFCSAKHQCTG